MRDEQKGAGWRGLGPEETAAQGDCGACVSGESHYQNLRDDLSREPLHSRSQAKFSPSLPTRSHAWRARVPCGAASRSSTEAPPYTDWRSSQSS